jgi:hypothetical protein
MSLKYRICSLRSMQMLHRRQRMARMMRGGVRCRRRTSSWSGGYHSAQSDSGCEWGHHNTARSTYCNDRKAWTDGLATSFRLQPKESGRNGHVSLQDHHRSAPTRPESAQSADRGENRMQRAQPDDCAWHAGVRPDLMIRGPREEDATGRFLHAPTRPASTLTVCRSRCSVARTLWRQD